MDCCQVGGQSFLVTVGKLSLLLQFRTPAGLHWIHTAFPRGLWFRVSGVRANQITSRPLGSADMKNFQQLLKQGDDEETSRGCTERGEGGHKDAETPSRRHPTPFGTRAANAPTQDYQVRHLIILTLSVLINKSEEGPRIQTVHCVQCVCLCVCVVPQLSVPAAQPASGLPEDLHLPESHFSQWDWLQRQGDSTALWVDTVAFVVLCYKWPIIYYILLYIDYIYINSTAVQETAVSL